MSEQLNDHTSEFALSIDDREALVELLLDLKHDLGKHLVLPLTLLPATAPDELFVETAQRALSHTRHGPRGVLSASALWARFLSELGEHGSRGLPPAEFDALRSAVDAACAWQQRLVGHAAATPCSNSRVLVRPCPLSESGGREALLHDFRNVGLCIQRLLRRVRASDTPSTPTEPPA